VIRWTDSEGRLQVQQYVHDEYRQLLTELGAIGVVLLAALVAGVIRLLWGSHPLNAAPALWAGSVAACAATAVHAGFDFVWHVPAVPLTVAVLVGLAVAPVTRMDRAT
jgi:4-amino-4-deoxy-L-arabinose transferase-like glycosyltransferase